MSGVVSDAEWKRRFEAFALVRMTGVVLVLAGALMGARNPLGENQPVLGVLLALAGVATGFGGPRLLRRRWEAADRA